MNPNIKNLNSLQVAYDRKLMQYNIDIKDFLAETFASGGRDTNFRRSFKKERRKLRKQIRASEGSSKNLSDLKLHQSLLFSDDSLVKAIMNMKKKASDLELYPNTAYFGSGFLSGGPAANPQECLKRCAAKRKCTGAWFEGKGDGSGFCQLRRGPGPPGGRWMGRTAIQNKLLVLMGKVKEANAQLITMNQEISEEINKLNPNLDQVSGENQTLNAKMANDFLRLQAQKEILDHGLRDYDSSAVEAQETERMATYRLLRYRFFYLILIAAIATPFVISYGLPSLWIIMLLVGFLLLLFHMKTIALYVFIVTILYMAAYVVPLSTA